MTRSEFRAVRHCLLVAQGAAIAAITIGGLVLVGWWLRLGVLTSVLSGYATMKPNTALGFVLSGLSLWLWRAGAKRPGMRNSARAPLAQACAAVVVLVGLTTLGEYLLHLDFGIDELLFREALAATQVSHPGRMASATALGFLILGMALVTTDAESRHGLRPSQYFALVATWLGLVALLGYIYDVRALYQFSAYASVALPTCLLFVALGVGTLCARPDRGMMAVITGENDGGMMARRILPVAIVLPIALGWLRLQGERAGLYGTGFGLTLFATTDVMVFTTVVWLSARSLNRVDADRRRAEESLRTSERRFRSLVEATAQIVWTADAAGRTMDMSEEFYRYSGLGRGGDVVSIGAIATHPDDRERIEGLWRRAVKQRQPFAAELRVRSVTGEYRYFEARTVPVLGEDGSVIEWVGMSVDIHERKRAEEALRESQAMLSLIYDTTSDVMVLYRRDAQSGIFALTSSNHALFELDEHPQESLEHIAAAASTGEPQRYEEERDMPAGRAYFECIDIPIIAADGICEYVLRVIHDVTARRRAEAAEKTLVAQLRQAQKLQALGTLAGGIAHDFNNILAAITGNAKLAIADLPPNHPTQVSLTEIDKAAARAADVVRSILTFSRQQEPKRRVIQLRPVVEEALKLLRATVPTMIRIGSEFEEGIPDVSADSNQVHQVLMNLGTNAAHAMAEHGGRLDVHVKAVTVNADLARTSAELREGRYVCLSFSDSGCGMDKATCDRVFEPFFTTKAPGQGTGLGLSIVHGIMKSHDGAVTVYSEPGKGTTFRLYFPAAEPVAAEAERSPHEVHRGHGERVLYVDDEESLVFLMTRMLERLGYEVIGFTDASQALQAFRSRPHDFDVVVTDLSMPGMSGTELARELLRIRPEIPIIMTSGYIRPEDITAAQRAGTRDLILKPNTIEELGQALHRLLVEQQESQS